MSTKRIARRREVLWKRSKGKCFYCKIDTVLPKDLAAYHGISIEQMGRKLRPVQYHRMATIDHLIPRYDIRRLSRNNTAEERTVLCCWKCNNDRAKREYEALPIETQQAFTRGKKPAMFVLRDMANADANKATLPLTKITWRDRILSWFREIRKKYEYIQGRSRASEDRTAPQCGKA